MSTSTQSSSGTVVVVGIAVVVAALFFGFQSWFSGEPDPELERPDQDRRVIELQAVWLERQVDEHIIDPWDDRAGERLVAPQRDVTITYWVDGDQHSVIWDEEERGHWKEHFAAPVGSHIRLLIEQGSSGGFLQCHILQDGTMVAYEHRNDAGDCNLEWVVVESP